MKKNRAFVNLFLADTAQKSLLRAAAWPEKTVVSLLFRGIADKSQVKRELCHTNFIVVDISRFRRLQIQLDWLDQLLYLRDATLVDNNKTALRRYIR